MIDDGLDDTHLATHYGAYCTVHTIYPVAVLSWTVQFQEYWYRLHALALDCQT